MAGHSSLSEINGGTEVVCNIIPNERTCLLNKNDGSQHNLNVPSSEIIIITKPIKRRWYIVCSFSALAFIQGAVWNTWGPIAESALKVFPQWDNSTIALLSNWGSITFILFLFPMTYLKQSKGLRCAVLCTSFLLVFGTGIRCITLKGVLSSMFIHIGQFLNGVAGIIVNTAPLIVSADWFPPNERTTATAFSSVMSAVGAATSFVVGPLVLNDSVNSNISNSTHKQKLEQNIILLMQIEFFAAFFVVICICVYFPSKPFRPPSTSATMLRWSLAESISIILRHHNLLMLTCAYALTTAVFGNWISVMGFTLKTLNMSQMKSGWLGFFTDVAGCTCAVLVGRFSDIFRKRMKFTITTGLILYTVLTIIFALVIKQLFSISEAYIDAIVIMSGVLTISLGPLFCELASEMAYPIDENVTGALLLGSSNAFGAIFLSLFFIPNIGVDWMNWCLIASGVISIPFVIMMKEVYQRSNVDEQ